MHSRMPSRVKAFFLALGVLLGSAGLVFFGPATTARADDGGYPDATKPCIWSPYKSDGSGYWCAGYEWGPDHNNENTIYSGRGYAYRNCTDYVAWKLQSLGVADSWTRGLGNGGDWYDKAANKNDLGRGDTPKVGAAAIVPSNTPGYGGYGHVAYVEAVDKDSSGTVTSITVSEYNYDLGGHFNRRSGKPSDMKFTKFVYFGDKMTDPDSPGRSSSTATPQIFQIKRTTDPSGVRQVYAATNTAVTEGWWVPGGDGVHLHEVIKIDQQNIVGFDKVNLPGGTQAVYAATSDGVWESWWKPDGSSGQSKIVSGLGGVKGVYAYNTTENGQFVHHLYILAGDGLYEAWWKDGGDGVHLSRLTNINGGTTFTVGEASANVMQFYVATPTWVYEVWWIPGSNNIHTGTILNITQGDIRQLAKAETLADGTQRLYTTTSTTVWESAWGGGRNGIQNTAKVVSQTNGVMSKKTVGGGADQLYVATGAKVQEYWWTSSNSGGGTLIDITQGNIGAIDKVNDGSAQQLYTAAGQWVYETWWGGGSSPSRSGLFSVSH